MPTGLYDDKLNKDVNQKIHDGEIDKTYFNNYKALRFFKKLQGEEENKDRIYNTFSNLEIQLNEIKINPNTQGSLAKALLSIGELAFVSCELLQEFKIPNRVKELSIENNAFFECISLEKFQITDVVTKLSIGESAFEGCRALQNFKIPNSVKELSIEKFAFYDCQSLLTFTLPDPEGIETLSIEENAFEGCPIKEITQSGF